MTELLDFAELLLDTLVSLSLDFGVTLEDDDCAELLLVLSFWRLEEVLESPDDRIESTELLDFGATLSLLDEESSPGRTKLLSSSQAATKNARPNPSKKRFIQKILLRYVVYLANFPSSLHPVFIIFPAKKD